MTLKEITEMDDLISRWEAFKAVMDDENITNAMDSANDGEMHRTKRAASRIIAGLPSAQQWIPCSEQMPNEYEPVITSTPRGIMIMQRVMEWDGYMWQDEADDLHIIGFVQAWMPLPKPYEVKQ